MLALSMHGSLNERGDSWEDDEWEDDERSAVASACTWRQWLEMLRPDTPARHQVSPDEWDMKPGSDETLK